jgi:hypothetical protein
MTTDQPSSQNTLVRAEHVLDADERVAFGRAADPAPGRQIDTDARRRVAVEHRVDTGAAVEAVVTAEPLSVSLPFRPLMISAAAVP